MSSVAAFRLGRHDERYLVFHQSSPTSHGPVAYHADRRRPAHGCNPLRRSSVGGGGGSGAAAEAKLVRRGYDEFDNLYWARRTLYGKQLLVQIPDE